MVCVVGHKMSFYGIKISLNLKCKSLAISISMQTNHKISHQSTESKQISLF